MKLCRFDQDRLGVVIGDQVHDVTDIQARIRAEARYDMQGDAVIAALPAWRARLEDAAAKAPGTPLAQVKLVAPVARPSKNMGAPAKYRQSLRGLPSRPRRTSCCRSTPAGGPRAAGPGRSSRIGAGRARRDRS